MIDKITLVTPPDDVIEDAIRILTFDLTTEQNQILSNAINGDNNLPNKLIIYVYQNSNDFKWLLDKKQKSSIIIFNAESINQTVVGYLSAQHNSFYFGELKNLSIANSSRIYSENEVYKIINKNSKEIDIL